MVNKVLLLAFASLSLSLAAPVPAEEDHPPTEVHRSQPRQILFDNSIPGTQYVNQTVGGPFAPGLVVANPFLLGPQINRLFPNFPLPWSVVLPPIPGLSGNGVLNERNLIRVFSQTNAATNATIGWYLYNPFENYNLNDIIGLIQGNGRSADDSPLDAGSVSKVPSLTVQQLNELQQMYNQQLTSVGQGVSFNTPNLFPTSLYSSSVQGSPYYTSPYLSQFNQYNPFAVPNYNAMFAPSGALASPLPGQESAVSAMFAPSGALASPLPGQESAVGAMFAPSGALASPLPGQESAVSAMFAPSGALASPLPGQESAVSAMFAPSGALTSPLPGQESAVSAMFAPSGALASPLPGQESAVSGLRFGITAPIPEVKTKDSGKADGSKA